MSGAKVASRAKRAGSKSKKSGGRKSWREKLRPEMQPQVCDDPKGRGRMLLPTPLLIAEEVCKLKKGSVISVEELRAKLAKRFDADLTCPLMTGIFLNIVAGATEEDFAAGEEPLSPYWRVIGAEGTLNEKIWVGVERQAARLRAEGHLLERDARGRWILIRQAKRRG